MIVERDDEGRVVTCNGVPLQFIDTYDYLGTMVSNDGKGNLGVLNKMIKANDIVYPQIHSKSIKKKEISNETKLLIFETVFQPVLLYTVLLLRSWTVLDRNASKVTVTEMRFPRRIQYRKKYVGIGSITKIFLMKISRRTSDSGRLERWWSRN